MLDWIQLEKKSNARIKWIDIARGIGILAVMCSHAGIGSRWIVPYYIPMFVLLSGMTFSMRDRIDRECLDRAIKIAVQYFKYSFLVFLMYMPLLILDDIEINEVGHFITINIIGVFYARKSFYFPYDSGNIIFLQYGNGPMWFLPFLSISYVMFVYLKRSYENKKYSLLVGEIFLYLVFTVIMEKLPFLMPWSIDLAFLGAVFVFIGKIYFNGLIRGRNGLNKNGVVTLAEAVFMAIGWHKMLELYPMNWNLSVRDYNEYNPIIIIFLVYMDL